jgi:hypothetical protein
MAGMLGFTLGADDVNESSLGPIFAADASGSILGAQTKTPIARDAIGV